MACGVHLGILLICLIKAEHVLCLWAQQAQGQNGNTNVGFSQMGSGFGGSDPQNQLRQASGSRGSAQSSSFNTDPDVSSGYSQRFPSSGNTQGDSQPARRGYASVMLVQSSSESKSNRPNTSLSQGNVQKTPKKKFTKKELSVLFSNVASGRSISRYDQTLISKKRTLPVLQGTQSTSNNQSNSSESLQSPRESYSFKPASHQSAAQKASSLSSTGAAEPHRIPPRTKTSASAPGIRMYLNRSPVASKSSYFSSLRNERTRNNPSQTQAGNKYPRKPVPVNARNLPASGTSSVGTYGLRFHPTRTHNIPQHFGGNAIRRLKEPADQKEVHVGRLQQAFVPPQRPPAPQRPSVPPQRPPAPQRPSVPPQRPPSPQRPSVPPQRPPSPQRPSVPPQRPPSPQRPSVPPQRPPSPQRPSVPPQRPPSPQRPSVPPQRPPSPQRPSVPPQRPPAPQRPSVPPQRPSSPQRPSVPPQRPSASFKPRVQSVRPETKWIRISRLMEQPVPKLSFDE